MFGGKINIDITNVFNPFIQINIFQVNKFTE